MSYTASLIYDSFSANLFRKEEMGSSMLFGMRASLIIIVLLAEPIVNVLDPAGGFLPTFPDVSVAVA